MESDKKDINEGLCGGPNPSMNQVEEASGTLGTIVGSVVANVLSHPEHEAVFNKDTQGSSLANQVNSINQYFSMKIQQLSSVKKNYQWKKRARAQVLAPK